VGALDALARHVVETGVAPAAAVAVTDASATRATGVCGDVGPGTLWQIGSVGKSFTAVLALQLVEQGELDLHAPVTEYLPWLRLRSSAPITLHHLLTHTAGLVTGAELAPASTYDVLALAGGSTSTPPGERFWYSNVGYRAVGLVLEAVSGTSYPRLVQELVLEPLGMRASAPAIVNDLRGRMAPCHWPFFDDRPWRPEHGIAPAPWVESAEADGCIACSVEELAAYLRELLAGAPTVLPGGGFAAMATPHTVDERDGHPYGYGLALHDGGFWHTGSMIGSLTFMWAEPAAGLGVVAFANGLAGARALGEAALAEVTGRPVAPFAPALDEPLVDDGSAPGAWLPFLGHYRSHNPWLSNFRVAAREGGLVFGNDGYGGERSSLVPTGPAQFRVGAEEWSPERLAFDELLDGRAQRATLSGGPYYRTFTP
jgi:CubicO group peptidase (beta-lactamase class C family)